MPLLSGKKNIGPNIKEMEKSGHPYRVARAAALNKAYGPPKRKSTSSGETKMAKEKSEKDGRMDFEKPMTASHHRKMAKMHSKMSEMHEKMSKMREKK